MATRCTRMAHSAAIAERARPSQINRLEISKVQSDYGDAKRRLEKDIDDENEE